MASISIIDTGHLTTTNVSDTQAATVVNSGSAITLKSVEFNYQGSANYDDSPLINTNSGSVVGFGSVNPSKITIRGFLNRTSSTDMDTMTLLNQLKSTYGVKLLYYSSTTDGYRDITDSLGTGNSSDVHKDNNFGGTATPHLHVKITNFSTSDSADSNIIRYTLELLETA